MAGKKEAEKPVVFTKEQALSSRQYQDKRDMLNVILHQDKLYTLTEIEELIEKFMKGKVK